MTKLNWHYFAAECLHLPAVLPSSGFFLTFKLNSLISDVDFSVINGKTGDKSATFAGLEGDEKMMLQA